MRHRLILTLVLLVVAALALAFSAGPAHAMQAWISRVESDCAGVQAEAALIWDKDDLNGNDRFRLYVYDHITNALLSSLDEQLTQEQSPWFWQTHRIAAAPSKAKVRLELWDIDKDGNRVRRMDTVIHDCVTGASWRPADAIGARAIDPPPPTIAECQSYVPFYSTNVAPLDGTVTVLWSYGPHFEDTAYFLALYRIRKGEYLDPDTHWLGAPCGVYIRLYYQPDTTKAIYYLPSQFWPGDAYGMPSISQGSGTRYYTFFPLDGPRRPPETAR